jgi:hypothetical protein
MNYGEQVYFRGSGFIESGSGSSDTVLDPIRFQSFDDQKLEKLTAGNFFYIFFYITLQFTYL